MLLFGQTAGAEPLVLEWEAEDPCPNREQVLSAVAELVTHTPTQRVDARVQLRSTGAGYTGELRVGAGQRTLVGHTCQEVADAAVVILALAVDASARVEAEPDPRAAVAVDAPESAAEAPPRAVPAHPTRPVARVSEAEREVDTADRKLAFDAGLRGALDVGSLPHPSLGLALTGRLASKRVFAELAANGFLPRFGELPNSSSLGADIGLLFGSVASCGAPTRWGVFGCAGLELGALVGRGRGVDQPVTRTTTWLALSAGALGRYALSRRVRVEAGLGLVWPLTRPEFGLDGLGIVHRPAPICGRFSLGLDFR